MKKRILFISDHGDPLSPLGSEQAGGQNNYVRQLALALEKEGYAVDVATHWNSRSTSQIEHFGVACRVIRLAAGKQRYVPKDRLYHMMPEFFNELSEVLDLSQYSVMHTHYWLSGIVGAAIKNKHDILWVHTNHSLGIEKRKATGKSEVLRILTERTILRSADHIVATTQTEKKIIKKLAGKAVSVPVISIGVDKAFHPNQLSKNIFPYFAFAGRLQATKGIYTLIQAFKLLLQESRSAALPKLIIAGGSKPITSSGTSLPQSKELREAIKGFEHHIKFVGPQSQKQLARLFGNSIATIIPSYYESFGMVAAEAQACGSPVIASKVGGLQDVVKHGITGLHVEQQQPDQLARAMFDLLNNPKLAGTLGRQAAVYAEKEFNWDVLAYKMAKLYKGAIYGRKIVLAGD